MERVACLRGHQAQVGGLCSTPAGDTALTSSEDGSLRLWDLRTFRSVRAVMVSPHVEPLAPGADDEGPSLCAGPGPCAFVNPGQPRGAVLVAAGAELLAFDLRGSDEIVYRGPPVARQRAREDINDFSVSSDGCMVAAPTDEGTVELYSASDLTHIRSLEGGHENIAGVVRFRAGDAELLSGGFDERITLWDPSNGKRRCRYEVRDLLPAEEAANETSGAGATIQILNPPFVLSFAAGGPEDALGVGLGNGAVLVLPGGRKPHRGCAPWAVRHGHAAGTDAIAWLAGAPLLASAGRDGAVRLWDVKLSSSRGGGGRNRKAAATAAGKNSGAEPGEAVPVAELRLPEGEKPNAISNAGADTLLLADTSGTVAVLRVAR